jgi:hypothetical protein
VTLQIPDQFHRGTVRTKTVRHERPRLAVALHRSFENLQGCRAIPALCRKYFEHFAFVIDRASQVMCLTVDPDKHLVQIPSPLRIRSMVHTPPPFLRSEHRAEPVPPKAYRLVADIDATLEQQIFDLPQWLFADNQHVAAPSRNAVACVQKVLHFARWLL